MFKYLKNRSFRIGRQSGQRLQLLKNDEIIQLDQSVVRFCIQLIEIDSVLTVYVVDAAVFLTRHD